MNVGTNFHIYSEDKIVVTAAEHDSCVAFSVNIDGAVSAWFIEDKQAAYTYADLNGIHIDNREH